jgi:hypothetical protein
MDCVVLEQNCLSGLPGEVAEDPSKANLRHFGERGVPWLSLHISICGHNRGKSVHKRDLGVHLK